MIEASRYLKALHEKDDRIVLEIYKKFYPKIESFILKKSGSRDEAQDIFQDALLYLIIKHSEKELQINSFEAFLFVICKNMWYSKIKSNKNRVMNELTNIPIDREEHLSLYLFKENQMELYLTNFQKLSENCKNILSNYFNGLSYEEIVNELAYSSINTVRQRVFKCRTKIIQLIKADANYTNLSK